MRVPRAGSSRRDVLRRVGTGAVAAAGAVGLGLGGVGESVLADEHDTYRNPVGPIGFGDVSLVRTCDGTYYAYGTETPADVVPIATSNDLVDWTYVGAAFEEQPDWRDDPDAGVWAPSVNQFDDQYYLYYSFSTWGSQDNPGIGLATADDPAGPFTDQGPVFRAEDLGVTNAIDGELYVVDDTPYMVWGSWYGIYGVELTPDGTDYVPGTTFHLAGDMKEGAMIIEENDYYYLFYSTGHCCEGADSTYEVEVGRSDSFFGPYVNRNGDDLRELNDHHEGVSVLTGTDQFIGPGHNTAIRDDDGDWWMVYHVEATADVEERVLMIDPIRWDDDGWPIVGDDGTPSAEGSAPRAGADVCGGRDGDDDNGNNGDGDDDNGDDGNGDETITVGDYEATDTTEDGLYNDFDGDGETTHDDVTAFFEHLESDGIQQHPNRFDFANNGEVGFSDVIDLLRRV